MSIKETDNVAVGLEALRRERKRAKRRAYREKPENKARKKAYREKPEVRARENKQRRTPENRAKSRAYNAKPEAKQARRAQWRVWAKKNRARITAYNAKPETKARKKKWDRDRIITPEIIKSRKETAEKYRASSRGMATIAANLAKPEVKQSNLRRARKYKASAKGAAWLNEYSKRPEVRARRLQWERESRAKWTSEEREDYNRRQRKTKSPPQAKAKARELMREWRRNSKSREMDYRIKYACTNKENLRAKSRLSRRSGSAHLTDAYIRHVLQVRGQPITPESIATQRASIIAFRNRETNNLLHAAQAIRNYVETTDS